MPTITTSLALGKVMIIGGCVDQVTKDRPSGNMSYLLRRQAA